MARPDIVKARRTVYLSNLLILHLQLSFAIKPPECFAADVGTKKVKSNAHTKKKKGETRPYLRLGRHFIFSQSMKEIEEINILK